MGRKGIGRRSIVVGIAGLLAAPAVVRAQGQTGVALVIGNSKYQWEASLPNVRRDVPEIAKRFQALGLKTELVQDVGRDAMRRAADTFIASSRGANLAAFYFAGHGAAWGKATFLVPVDADLSDPSTVKSLLPVASFRDGMGAAAHRLLVFDNCRNNPADGWGQREVADYSGNYIGNVNTGAPNTLTLFSTAPGRVAVDGPAGDFSPFALALMRQLEAPSVDLQTLPSSLRRDLLIATEGRQVAFDDNTYQQAFVLKGAGGKGPAAGRSGWASDPSRIIELPNAYAFAQQSGLLLPAGLIAHKPAGKSADAHKVGAYKSTDAFGGPAVVIVLSVEEQASAEVIMSLHSRTTGNSGWRFMRGTLSGRSIQVVPSTKAKPFDMTWIDANSGRMGTSGGYGGNKASGGTPFTRLDG
jgi:Caspase domain